MRKGAHRNMNISYGKHNMTRLFFTIALAAIFTNGCGGGGGSGAPTNGPNYGTFSLQTQSLSFHAKSLAESVPIQYVYGSASGGTVSGTLYLIITSSGPAVRGIGGVTISGTTGNAGVYPQFPNVLGAGTYTSTITVRACMNDASCNSGELQGSPRQVTVTYIVESKVQTDIIAPGVATASVASDVVIRGANLAGATSVSFGATSAGSFSIVSNSEIRARNPGLSAGTYPVMINGGGIAFNASLTVLAPVTFAYTVLPQNSAADNGSSILYDARHQALYVLNRSSVGGAISSKLWRYAYTSGNWNAPSLAPITDPRGLALSMDGRTLFVTSRNVIDELDSTTLAVNGAYTNPPASLFNYFVGLAPLNNGFVLASGLSDTCCPSFQTAYLYSTADHTFSQIELVAGNGVAGNFKSSANGSIAISDAAAVYLPSSDRLESYKTLNLPVNANSVVNAAMDPIGSRFLMIATSLGYFANVYDTTNYQMQGSLPSSTLAAYLDTVNMRAYTLDAANEIRTYNIGTTSGAAYSQIGTGTPVSDPGTIRDFNRAIYPALAASPDGKTLFIAGTNNVLIVPVQ